MQYFKLLSLKNNFIYFIRSSVFPQSLQPKDAYYANPGFSFSQPLCDPGTLLQAIYICRLPVEDPERPWLLPVLQTSLIFRYLLQYTSIEMVYQCIVWMFRFLKCSNISSEAGCEPDRTMRTACLSVVIRNVNPFTRFAYALFFFLYSHCRIAYISV